MIQASREVAAIQTILEKKTKKQRKNALRVIFGRKKDRGNIKKEIKKIVDLENKIYYELMNKFPALRMFANLFGGRIND